MNRKHLNKIIKNYSRNKKRINEIRRDYFGVRGIDYSTTGASNPKQGHDITAEQVHAFMNDIERQRLQMEIDAVDRMFIRLDSRQKMVYKEIVVKNRKAYALEPNGISERTVYRIKNEILEILNEELAYY